MGQNLEQLGLPASYGLQLLALVERWGVTERDLLAGLPFRRKDLEDPNRPCPVSTGIALVERARALTREPALGFHFGLQMSISAHGYLSFAAMSAPTVGEALALAVRYAPVRTTALALSLTVSGSRAALTVDERVDYGSARDVVLLGLLVGLWHVGNVLLGREVTKSSIELTLSKPPWYARFKDVAPRVRYGQPRNRLVFDAALLNTTLLSSNPESLVLARKQCEQLLAAARAREGFADRLRRNVAPAERRTRSYDELAATMHMSARTLRRKLAQEGTSYSVLKDEERRNAALLLLGLRDLSIKQIAVRLGYADAANFTRAFRRWMGQTPSAFRRRKGLPRMVRHGFSRDDQ